jgi:hypothetical protein
MSKEVIVARLTHEGQQFIGKREQKMYDESSKVDSILLAHANVGLRLEVQRKIREALQVKHGLRKVSTGGVEQDLSAIENV